MTGPIQGVFTVLCEVCAARAYSSDEQPPADRDVELTRFADARCPRGGTAGGCPHTTAARVAVLARRGQPLLGTVTALTPTSAVVAVAGTAVNAARDTGDLTAGDSVVIQHAGGRWVITGRTQ